MPGLPKRLVQKTLGQSHTPQTKPNRTTDLPMNNNHSTINYNDCNFHDFSATTRCNYSECDRQTKTNTQTLIIPTETEVWQFLQDECKLDISQISISSKEIKILGLQPIVGWDFPQSG
jgi:hypothetical protein